jgi:hypothetical protein
LSKLGGEEWPWQQNVKLLASRLAAAVIAIQSELGWRRYRALQLYNKCERETFICIQSWWKINLAVNKERRECEPNCRPLLLRMINNWQRNVSGNFVVDHRHDATAFFCSKKKGNNDTAKTITTTLLCLCLLPELRDANNKHYSSSSCIALAGMLVIVLFLCIVVTVNRELRLWRRFNT